MKQQWTSPSLTLIVAVALGAATGCDDDSKRCAEGRTTCGGACVDTQTDPEHCGACQSVCDATELCVAGGCVLDCGTDLTNCNGSCVDTEEDDRHCGGCDAPCDGGEACQDGSCIAACGDFAVSETAACQTCAEAHCCAALAACDVGTDCAGLISCFFACADEACQHQCEQTYTGGANDAIALLTCASESCPQSCRLGDGICGTTIPTISRAFRDCLDESCCDLFLPCFDDADCAACLTDPHATGCATNPAYQAYASCASTHCPAVICGTDLGYETLSLNQCLQASCCGSFTACANDATCFNCLMDPTIPGCDTNVLLAAYEGCKEAHCPQTVCGSGIGFSGVGSEPEFPCNLCVEGACCAELGACVGDGSGSATDLCVACLDDPSSAACNDATIAQAAADFSACATASCAAECTAF